MLCEKCGKNNSNAVTVCKHCGQLLPVRSGCGGFCDILSYEPEQKSESNAEISLQLSEAKQRAEAAEKQMTVFKKKSRRAGIAAWLCLLIAVAALVHTYFSITHANEWINKLQNQMQILQEENQNSEE